MHEPAIGDARLVAVHNVQHLELLQVAKAHVSNALAVVHLEDFKVLEVLEGIVGKVVPAVYDELAKIFQVLEAVIRERVLAPAHIYRVARLQVLKLLIAYVISQGDIDGLRPRKETAPGTQVTHHKGLGVVPRKIANLIPKFLAGDTKANGVLQRQKGKNAFPT